MSYYDPPPDPPYFASAEPEASIQPSTSAQNQSPDAPTSSSLRKCSVKNCGRELPESHNGKMCDECRGRHRVYASTKRQKRKMEKMAVGLTGLAAAEGAVFTPPESGHGRSITQIAHPTPSGPIASASSSAADGGESSQSDIQTPAGWHAQIDPRLFQSSPSGIGNATSSPSPHHADHEGTPDHDERQSPPPDTGEASTSNSAPTRYCSIKGCRQVLPAEHSYKMCQSCRDRYREYGNVKREKWRKNKEAALASLEEARLAEEQRRKDAGLPSLAELPAHERKVWEENLMPRVPPPPPAGTSALPPIRMCTVSHCHVILSGDYEYRRCEQHRYQNRHHSKLKRVRDKEEKGLLQPEPSSGQTNAREVVVDGAESLEDVVEVVSREDHVCQIKGCYNFLDPKTPWLMCDVHRQIDQGVRQQHLQPPSSGAGPSGSTLTPPSPAKLSSEHVEVDPAASATMQHTLYEHEHSASLATSTAGSSSALPPPSSVPDEQTTSYKDPSASTAQPQSREATPDETSSDPAASKDVHLHPKLRVPYFFHPAYVSYPGHPPMLMSIPSPFAPPGPGGLPPNQFGPSQFVQSGSPFVQGGPYAYPYMMPIPPPTQPSPFTNPSSAPSPFASAPYPMAPGWYGPPPPPSEHQEVPESGPHSTAAVAQNAIAASPSATSQHPPPASRPESSFMSTMPPASRPLTFKHAPGSSVFNAPPTHPEPGSSERPAPPSPTVPAPGPLPPSSSASTPAVSNRPLEGQQQPHQDSSRSPSTPPPPSSVPAFYNPAVGTAALASADNTLATIRRGSDPAFAPPPRPGVRRRSAALVGMAGDLEIVMYDPKASNRKRRRLEDGDTSPEPTLSSSSMTPGLSNETPISLDEVLGLSAAGKPHGSSSATSAPTGPQTVSSSTAFIATSAANEAVDAPSSTIITPSRTSASPALPAAVGVPPSENFASPDTSQPSDTPNNHSQSTQATPIAVPHKAVATPVASPTRVCAGARCRRKVRVGALCERCVGKAKHAKQLLRARHRLEPVKIGKKISIR
ncbi:unnamed protein product [Peniophora sp. CBMAI 1063]|nr:unnamed protein product [Peniophora sp. CBMAI 1063]